MRTVLRLLTVFSILFAYLHIPGIATADEPTFTIPGAKIPLQAVIDLPNDAAIPEGKAPVLVSVANPDCAVPAQVAPARTKPGFPIRRERCFWP